MLGPISSSDVTGIIATCYGVPQRALNRGS